MMRGNVLTRACLLAALLFPLLGGLGDLPAGVERAPGDAAYWVEPMKAVRSRFTGLPGTLAQFGDSITVTMAFWAPLAYVSGDTSPETASALKLVRAYLQPPCWRDWKGPEYGSQGSMTIRWAHENVGAWLAKLQPEVAHILFGTNDLDQLELEEYERKTREVVERCLENGTVVILSTIPPRSGMLEKSRAFAEAARRVARAAKVPLIDFFGEVLKRRPDDWDGSGPAFKDTPGDEYQVPTLISRDGVHPSNPAGHQHPAEESLRKNGYLLRSHLTLLAYAGLIRDVLDPRRETEEAAIRKAVTLYGSFDAEAKADRGGGELALGTRSNHPSREGEHVFEKGIDATVFRIARDRGVRGGALECVDVLPRNGRVYFPAKGNIAYREGGWGGALSVWINTDPDQLLKTPFCDPIQITQKGASNGGIWFDFNDSKPREMRFGAFPAVAADRKPVPESDPAAPIVRRKSPGLHAGDWHHVAMAWKGFDTGKEDGELACYVDGKLAGKLEGRAIAMKWDLERTGIYVAVSYVGLLDELALFDRPLGAEEVSRLSRWPGLLSSDTR